MLRGWRGSCRRLGRGGGRLCRGGGRGVWGTLLVGRRWRLSNGVRVDIRRGRDTIYGCNWRMCDLSACSGNRFDSSGGSLRT